MVGSVIQKGHVLLAKIARAVKIVRKMVVRVVSVDDRLLSLK